jgi:hypothetical protein
VKFHPNPIPNHKGVESDGPQMGPGGTSKSRGWGGGVGGNSAKVPIFLFRVRSTPGEGGKRYKQGAGAFPLGLAPRGGWVHEGSRPKIGQRLNKGIFQPKAGNSGLCGWVGGAARIPSPPPDGVAGWVDRCPWALLLTLGFDKKLLCPWIGWSHLGPFVQGPHKFLTPRRPFSSLSHPLALPLGPPAQPGCAGIVGGKERRKSGAE